MQQPRRRSPVPDIEQLFAIGQRRSISGILNEIMDVDDERQTWELGMALQRFHKPADRNVLLQQAFDRLPIRRGAPSADA